MPSGIYKHKLHQGFQKGNKVWEGKSLSEDHKSKLRKPKLNDSHFKGRTYDEIYGPKRAIIEKERRQQSRIAYHDRVGRKFRRPHHDSYQYRLFTKNVFERDNYTCQGCGQVSGDLQADHYPRSFASIVKEYDIKTMSDALKCKALWDVDNGRTLCKDCHRLTKTYRKHVKYHG